MKPLRWSGKEKTERTQKGAIGEFQPRQERDSGGLRLDKTKTAGSPYVFGWAVSFSSLV